MPDEFAIDETLRPYVIDAWRCNVCNRVWEDKRSARECCERLAATHLYRCPKCSDTYELGAPRSFEQHLKECDVDPFPRSPILECEVCDDGACLNCESPSPHPYPCPAAIEKYSAPPGTTAAVIDELRACIELTDDEELAATLETAASHLEDLAAKLLEAEQEQTDPPEDLPLRVFTEEDKDWAAGVRAVALDSARYPHDAALQRIEEWPLSDAAGLVDFIWALWTFADVYWHQSEAWLDIATCGWSGNESLIRALQKSPFWLLCWESTHRGGSYIFNLRRLPPQLREENPNVQP